MEAGVIVALTISVIGNVTLLMLLLGARRLNAQLVLHVLDQRAVIGRTSDRARMVGEGVAKCLKRQEERRAATA